MEKKKSNVDLSVLIIFFARPQTLQPVFDAVKRARPARLFLACDGPRPQRPEDVQRVEECKRIVSDIDWDCQVYTNYSEENQGCGRGPSNAITWAFQHTDRLLILEDDCVADDTLFPFMEQMLERYADDERIGLISGFNHFKHWSTGGDSYFFTKCGATLGWGTWKRVWDQYDYLVSDICDERTQQLLEREIIHPRAAKSRIGAWKKANVEAQSRKINYWDIQFGFLKYSQSYLCVVPQGNLIYNNGVGAGSTHTENYKAEQWKPGKILFMPTEPMAFPLKHPKHILCDREYDDRYFDTMGYPHPVVRLSRKIRRRLFG